ncbi:DgyrCDS4470 [Dimorphilus gyrociliatus]|uniref:DgyrCDS4470 n=1 Tax=Dimorphilus gyrociliatus TaxID=2664684 RepID=A0A7I8VLP9_9ANNE|nr:DgyrCDS4470 [Dimorphilus gyrociliatus]
MKNFRVGSWIFLSIYTISILCLQVSPQNIPGNVTFGVIISESTDKDDAIKAVDMAIEYINTNSKILPNTTVNYLINITNVLHSFQSLQAACWQATHGIVAFIGSLSSGTTKTISSISNGLHIPQITPTATDPELSFTDTYQYLLKMSAPDDVQSLVLGDTMAHYGWSRFGIIASSSDYGRSGVRELLKIATIRQWTVNSIHYFTPSSDLTSIDLTQSLIKLKRSGTRIVVLNCLSTHARIILSQASELGLLNKDWAWLATDGVTVVGELFDSCLDVPEHLVGLVGVRPLYGSGNLQEYFQTKWANYSKTTQKATEMRLFDSILAASIGLHNLLADNNNFTIMNPVKDICQRTSEYYWSDGNSYLNYIKQIQSEGTMNKLSFDNFNNPPEPVYEIVNLLEKGWERVGTWGKGRDEGYKLIMERSPQFFKKNRKAPSDAVINLNNVTLNITTILESPFVMRKTKDEMMFSKNKNQRLKGFCIDMLEKLSENLKFKYEIQIVKDGSYGTLDPQTKKWNGLIGEVMSEEIDMAVAPLTINYERQQVVGFTKPYMDLGLKLLLSKEVEKVNIYGYLEPFEKGLWAAVVGTFIICSVITCICSRLSPYSLGYYAQLDNETEHENLTLCNSLWATYGCWMQQGTETYPKCLSARIVFGTWWFAVMVISASYTANLAAFLTVKRLDTGIQSVNDLAKQRDIEYGTVKNSAPQRFFAQQLVDPYKTMFAIMNADGTYVDTAEAGIRKVQESYGKPKNERYAFVWDSAPLEYASNIKPCNTLIIGNDFNKFGYGLALKRNSPYLTPFTLEILMLRQSGYLETLHRKWFAGPCSATQSSSSKTAARSQTLESLLGVFYFIAVGIGLAVLILLLEFIVAAFRDVQKVKRK